MNDDRNDEEQPAVVRAGRVRIIGAEPASQRTGETVLPRNGVGGVAGEGDEPGSADVDEAGRGRHRAGARGDDARDAGGGDPAAAQRDDGGDGGEAPPAEPTTPEGEPSLPHWTEAPTGEVPAVLERRDPGDETGSSASVPGPSWREEGADWDAGDSAFEPSMLADDEAQVGSLGDVEDDDRQPWSFDLGEGGGSLDDVSDEDTMVVPAVPRHEYPPPAQPGSGAALDDEVDAAADPDRRDVPPADRLDRPVRPSRHRVRPGAQSPGERRLPPPAPERAGHDDRHLPSAIASGVVLAILTLVCFAVGTVASMVIVTAVIALAAAEAFAAFRRAGHQPATLLGLVATVSVMIAAYNKGAVAIPLVLVLLVAFCVVWYLTGVERGAEPVRGISATLLVFCWVSVFGAFGAMLLSPQAFPDRHGIAFLLGGLIAAVAYDIGALAIGSWIGNRPLAPSVSPNKTWEGFVGGAVCSVLAAVIVVHLIHPWTAPKAAVLGLVVAVVSPIGDLCESLVKRHLGLKDMGRMLPGHGGLLDRVDGLLFVLPATYYLVKAFHMG